MPIFESFETSKNKIRKIWERSAENDSNLKNVPTTTLDFTSLNFYKHVIDIPIVTDEIFPLFSSIHTITLRNFPEWALNMIEVTCLYELDEALYEFPFLSIGDANVTVNSFGRGEISDPDKKVGQIIIQIQNFKYWFNHIDRKHFYLKIFKQILITQFLKTGNINIQPKTTISLRIFNKRVFEKRGGKKE